MIKEIKKYSLESMLADSIERLNVDDVIKNLDSGANINIKASADKLSPLTLAAKIGSIEIAKVLIERGADLNLLTDILYILNRNDRIGMVEYSLTPLIAVVKNNKIDMIELLLDHGADIHFKDRENDNVMNHAVQLFNWIPEDQISSVTLMTNLLLERGASFNEKNKSSQNALDLSKENPKLLALFEKHLLIRSASQSSIVQSENLNINKRNRL